MKTRLVVGVVLVVVLAGWIWWVGAASGDLALPKQPVQFQKSDLVIQNVRIIGIGSGDFPTGQIEVTVRNRGGFRSPACMVGGLCITDIADPKMPGTVVSAVPIDGLDPEQTRTVLLTYPNVAHPWRAMLMVAADVPVAGKPSGQAVETIEYNNSFCSAFDTSTFTLPHWLKHAG